MTQNPHFTEKSKQQGVLRISFYLYSSISKCNRISLNTFPKAFSKQIYRRSIPETRHEKLAWTRPIYVRNALWDPKSGSQDALRPSGVTVSMWKAQRPRETEEESNNGQTSEEQYTEQNCYQQKYIFCDGF